MKIRHICAFLVAGFCASILCARDLPTFTENQKITTGFVNEMLGQRLACDGLKCGASVDSGSTRWIHWGSSSWLSLASSSSKYPSIDGDSVAAVNSASYLVVTTWPDGESSPNGPDPEYIAVENGEVLALSGNRLLVSRPSADTVEMFLWDDQSGWSHIRTFSGGATFGNDIALDADVVLIGEPDLAGGVTPGRVEVHYGFDAGPPAFQELVSPNSAAGDTFGAAVAVSGDWLAIGAPTDDGPSGSMVDVGAVYLYRKVGGSFQHWASIYGEAAGDRFGTDIQLAGSRLTRLVVGAPYATVGGFAQAGMATYFIVKNDLWSREARLVSSDPSAGDQLGTSVALSDLGVLAGAPFATGHSSASNAGAVLTFDELTAFIFMDGFETNGTGEWSATQP